MCDSKFHMLSKIERNSLLSIRHRIDKKVINTVNNSDHHHTKLFLHKHADYNTSNYFYLIALLFRKNIYNSCISKLLLVTFLFSLSFLTRTLVMYIFMQHISFIKRMLWRNTQISGLPTTLILNGKWFPLTIILKSEFALTRTLTYPKHRRLPNLLSELLKVWILDWVWGFYLNN